MTVSILHLLLLIFPERATWLLSCLFCFHFQSPVCELCSASREAQRTLGVAVLKHETIREQIGTSGADNLESEDILEIILTRFQTLQEALLRDFCLIPDLNERLPWTESSLAYHNPCYGKSFIWRQNMPPTTSTKGITFCHRNSIILVPCNWNLLTSLYSFFPSGLKYIQRKLFRNG